MFLHLFDPRTVEAEILNQSYGHKTRCAFDSAATLQGLQYHSQDNTSESNYLIALSREPFQQLYETGKYQRSRIVPRERRADQADPKI